MGWMKDKFVDDHIFIWCKALRTRRPRKKLRPRVDCPSTSLLQPDDDAALMAKGLLEEGSGAQTVSAIEAHSFEPMHQSRWSESQL